MPTLWSMFAVYGLVFALQNEKLKFLADMMRKLEFFDQMLACVYCTGFHCGWLIWLLSWVLQGTPALGTKEVIASVLLWALASAAWCYALDALIQYLEVNGGS